MSSGNPIRPPAHVIQDPPLDGAIPLPRDEEVSVTLTILGRPVRAKVVASGETLQGLREGKADTLIRVADWVRDRLFTHLSEEEHRLVAARQLIRNPAVAGANSLREEHLVTRLLAPGTVIEREGVTRGLGVPVAGQGDEEDLSPEGTDALLVPPPGGSSPQSAQVQETANRIVDLVRDLGTRFGGRPRPTEDGTEELEEESLPGSPSSSLLSPSSGTGRLFAPGGPANVEEGLQRLTQWHRQPDNARLVDRTWARYEERLRLGGMDTREVSTRRKHFQALFRTGSAQTAALEALASPSDGSQPSDAQRIEKLEMVQQMLESTWDASSGDYQELEGIVRLPVFDARVKDVLERVNRLHQDELLARHGDLESVDRMGLARTALGKAFAALKPLPIFTSGGVPLVEERQAAFDIAVRALRRVYKDEKSSDMQLFRLALRLPAEAPPLPLSTGNESLDANTSDLTPRRSPVRREPLPPLWHDEDEFSDAEPASNLTPSPSSEAPLSPISLDQSQDAVALDEMLEDLPRWAGANKKMCLLVGHRSKAILVLHQCPEEACLNASRAWGVLTSSGSESLIDRRAALRSLHEIMTGKDCPDDSALGVAMETLLHFISTTWCREPPEIAGMLGSDAMQAFLQRVNNLIAADSKQKVEYDLNVFERARSLGDRQASFERLVRMLRASGIGSSDQDDVEYLRSILGLEASNGPGPAVLDIRPDEEGLFDPEPVSNLTPSSSGGAPVSPISVDARLGTASLDQRLSSLNTKWSADRVLAEQSHPRLEALRLRTDATKRMNARVRLDKLLELRGVSRDDLVRVWSNLFGQAQSEDDAHNALNRLRELIDDLQESTTDHEGYNRVMDWLERFVTSTWSNELPEEIKEISRRLDGDGMENAFVNEALRLLESSQEAYREALRVALALFISRASPPNRQAGFDRLVEVLRAMRIGEPTYSDVQIVNSVLNKIERRT